MPVKIDPESFVSRNDLRFDFGLTDFVIDEAIRSGQLSPVQGASSRFLGKEVIQFLTDGRTNATAGRSGRGAAESTNAAPQPLTRPLATSAVGMTERKQSMTTEESKGVVRLFNEEVAAIMASGHDRGSAVEIVATRNPALHKQYLLATQPSAAARRSVEEAY